MKGHRPRATERRGFPRVLIRVPVALVHESGAVVAAESADIARRGMQIRCDRRTAYALHPSGRPIHDDGPTIDAHFCVPIGRRHEKIDVRCRMVHLSLMPEADAEEQVAIGLEFAAFIGDSEATFERFIRDEMRPVEARGM